MGKGKIISGGTDGQYQVRVLYSSVEYHAQIERIDARLIVLQDAYDNAPIETPKEVWEKSILGLQITALEKRKTNLEENVILEEDISAWCADLTEDLSGDIGTVEIPGESTNIQIQPGYSDNAIYNLERDGQLVPTYNMNAAGWFYNLAMLPGWQKWKPLFRYATIDSIKEDNKADITIENIKSSQQELEINQANTLSDVEIEYMDCDSSAFEEGDNVLVKFEGQDWNKSKIVGFKSAPQPCKLGIIEITFNDYNSTRSYLRVQLEYYFEGDLKQYSYEVESGESPFVSYIIPDDIPPEEILEDTEIKVYLLLAEDSMDFLHEGWPVRVPFYKNGSDVVVRKEADIVLVGRATDNIEIDGRNYKKYPVVNFSALYLIRYTPLQGYPDNVFFCGGRGTYFQEELLRDVQIGHMFTRDIVRGRVINAVVTQWCPSYTSYDAVVWSTVRGFSNTYIQSDIDGKNPVFNNGTDIITHSGSHYTCDDPECHSSTYQYTYPTDYISHKAEMWLADDTWWQIQE